MSPLEGPVAARPDPGPPTPFFRFYRLVARAAAPLAYARVRRRLTAQGVAADRIPERMGHATLPRPDGPLAWFHAASVGESVSVLALIARLLALRPGLQALITTGTGTSAQVLAGRMPAGCRHQFAPLDSTPALRRFLSHWRPDACIFVESELWPQMVSEARATGAPLALLNARMSATSLRNWGKFPDTSRWLLDHFALIRTQDQKTLEGLRALGCDEGILARGPNLKAMSQPLPADPAALSALRGAFAGTPLWLAASTHPGEEAACLDAHHAARPHVPGLRMILAPRHPERGEEVARLIASKGLTCARRSEGAAPAEAEVYLADTMGEMGLWYALSPLCFLGASFGSQGGHNLYEPAREGTVVIHGPNTANFAESYAEFDAKGAAVEAASPADLSRLLPELLTDAARLEDVSARARRLALAQDERLDGVAQLVLDTLLPERAGPTGAASV